MKDEFFKENYHINKNMNFLNQQEQVFKNDILNNKKYNNNKNEIFNFLKEEKEEIEQPFFIMTLEFEKGKHKKIKIFPDSDPTELAFNFCKDNNLDFATMKYINSEIENLVLKFKTNTNLEEITNNSIQEVEEENMITDKTLNSNEKSKDDSLNKENNKINDNEKKDYETLSQELIYSIESEKKIENEKEKSINNKNNNNKNFNKEINNNEEITLNNNTMKESVYFTNSVRTNKDPITSADSNFISNASSCESPKAKNEKINLEEIKELSNDKIFFNEKFMEPVNKISIDNRIINNYNYFNFDKISKNNHNINNCDNHNIINNNNQQNGNLLIRENKDIEKNSYNKNFHFENIFNRKKETLKNDNKKFGFFSHNDFSKLLELKKKKDEEIRILEEEQLKENKKPTLEKEIDKTKHIINKFSNEKIENQNEKSKSNRTENIYNNNNTFLNKNLILDEIDSDLPNKFLFQKFEKLKKNNIKKDSKINELISKQQNKKPNKQGRNFHNNNNFNLNYNYNNNNNNNIVEKSVDIFLSGKDIFKTNKEENHLTSSNFDISITNRNLTNINTTNNNFFLQDFSQFTKQLNKISSNKKNKNTHKHIPLPTSPTFLNSKYKNNKLFQYEIFEGKKEYEPSFSKSKDFSQIKSYTYGNLNFTQRSSEKKSNRSLSRDNNINNSKNKSITEKIINKLYKKKKNKNKKKSSHFSYRMDNNGYSNYDKNCLSDDNNNNKSRKSNLKNSNEFDKGKKINYGEYLYKRSVEEKNLRNEKLEKIRSKLEKSDKDKFLFKPKINKNFHPLRNKSMFEISEIKINETQNNSNNDLNEKKSSSNKKIQKNIIYQNNNTNNINNTNQNRYIQKKLENLKKDFEYSFKPKINHNYNFSPGLNYFKKQEIYNEYSQRNDIGKNDSQKYNKNNSLPKSKKKNNTKKNSFNTCCSALMLRNKNL